uniref:Copine Va n=1 Tax=Oryzias sinensis TaxID=183150 RepID=A0A8C8E1S0_9TELE
MEKVEATATVADFDPDSGSIPATKVEITVSCRNLLDRDTFSKSDPSETEVIKNTLNPDFVRKYILDYFFEEKQNLRFDVYDIDSKSPDLGKHDFLGQVYCTLGEIVGSPASRLEKPLGGIPGKTCGTIILSAEELGNCRFQKYFSVFYFASSVLLGMCDQWHLIFTKCNSWFPPFTPLPLRHGKEGQRCFYYLPRAQRSVLMCILLELIVFNYQELVNLLEPAFFSFSQVSLLSFSVESEHTFLDYIKGGTQIHFTVAIDFTASNGNPSQSTSLHYMNPYQMNAYAMALKAVGEIIQDYDSDKMFPALGFGAKLPPDGRVSHEFPLNGNVENPYCNGMEGILEAYHQSLKLVQLYGPTNFAPVVNHVARYAAAVEDGSQYFILLIITDGVISDMAQTKEAIVNAAKLPMSIIIVGVGQAEFDAMVELDGDDVRISSRGKLAERDIVQFVPFRDYMDRTGNHVLSMARLAKDVLAEIPDQLISYMKSRAIKPNPVPPPYSTCNNPETTPL